MSTEYASYLKGNVDWTIGPFTMGTVDGQTLYADVLCHESIIDKTIYFFGRMYVNGTPNHPSRTYFTTMSQTQSSRTSYTGVSAERTLRQKDNVVFNNWTHQWDGDKSGNYMYGRGYGEKTDNVSWYPMELHFSVSRRVGGVEVTHLEKDITITPLPINHEKPQPYSSIFAIRDEKSVTGTFEVTCDEAIFMDPSASVFLNYDSKKSLTDNFADPDLIKLRLLLSSSEYTYDENNQINGTKLTYTINHTQEEKINYVRDGIAVYVDCTVGYDPPEGNFRSIYWKCNTALICTDRMLPVDHIESTNVVTMSAGDTQKLKYDIIAHSSEEKNRNAPQLRGVNFTSSNTSIVTVDPHGQLTALATGQAAITITSVDEYAYTPSKTIEVYVRSDTFPTFESDYEYLSAQTTYNIISALNELAATMAVSLGSSMGMFDMEYTTLKNMQPLLEAINNNVKQLCAAAGISHTLPASVPYRNINRTYYTMVNQWCRKIEAIHDQIT